MRDLIELCKIIESKYGEDVWKDKYVPPIGYYFKISNDFKKIEFVDGRKKENFILNPNYTFFKERLFYDCMISANKSISTKKKIHSVVGNSVNLKYSSIIDDKIEDYITEHFEILKTKYDLKTVDDFKVNGFLDLIKNLKFKEYVPEDITFKNTDKLVFVLDNPLDEFKEDYYKYLDKKIFLKNEHVIIEDGIRYGVISNNISLDAKKIYLSNNEYSNVPFRFSFDELVLLNFAFKLQFKDLTELLLLENPSFHLEVNGNFEISNYSANYHMSKQKEKEFEEISIVTSNYENPYKSLISGDRNSIKDFFDKRMKVDNSSYLLSDVIKPTFDIKKYFLKFKNKSIANLFITNKNILKLYFNRVWDIEVISFFEKATYAIYKYNFVYNEDFTKVKYMFDDMLTILNYFNGRYLELANTISELWQKLLKSKKDKEIEINNDEEFFFICGQALYYLSSLSKTSNKKGILLQDVFSLRDIETAKDKLIEKYDIYKYSINISDNNFINIIYNSLMSYKIGENVEVKENKNLIYYYQAGLIGKNIFYTSVKKEENENDEK